MDDLTEIIVHPADRAETARKLLAAAGDNPRLVRTGGLGAFYAPAAVVTAAGLGEQPAAEEKAAPAKRSNARSNTAPAEG